MAGLPGTFRLHRRVAAVAARVARTTASAALAMLVGTTPALAQALDEYRVKAGFLYNFIVFTEWPAGVGPVLNVCVYGPDPFGAELDRLSGKLTGGRALGTRRVASVSDLGDCQVVFISRAMADNLPRVIDAVRGKPVLTVADTPGAVAQGVALNMGTQQGRVTIQANLAAARANQLNISSKLLSLATEVRQ